ncbi:hypothetical protein J6590_010202 [Homalodisca vitripennis]|nr:hypothetical protein J6590_010202 [Homalodisca vitripennis]
MNTPRLDSTVKKSGVNTRSQTRPNCWAIHMRKLNELHPLKQRKSALLLTRCYTIVSYQTSVCARFDGATCFRHYINIAASHIASAVHQDHAMTHLAIQLFYLLRYSIDRPDTNPTAIAQMLPYCDVSGMTAPALDHVTLESIVQGHVNGIQAGQSQQSKLPELSPLSRCIPKNSFFQDIIRHHDYGSWVLVAEGKRCIFYGTVDPQVQAKADGKSSYSKVCGKEIQSVTFRAQAVSETKERVYQVSMDGATSVSWVYDLRACTLSPCRKDWRRQWPLGIIGFVTVVRYNTRSPTNERSTIINVYCTNCVKAVNVFGRCWSRR